MVSVTRIGKKILPHISRIFSARIDFSLFRYVGLASFFALVALNVWMQQITPNTFVLERSAVLLSPFSSVPHITFAKQLHYVGLTAEANNELALAYQPQPVSSLFSRFTPTVLGAQSEANDLSQIWSMEASYEERAYQYWKSVTNAHPDYRDAFVNLGWHASRLHQTDVAVSAFIQAHILDPNNEAIQQLALEAGVHL